MYDGVPSTRPVRVSRVSADSDAEPSGPATRMARPKSVIMGFNSPSPPSPLSPFIDLAFSVRSGRGGAGGRGTGGPPVSSFWPPPLPSVGEGGWGGEG